MRGATAPVAGSVKCASSAAIQSGPTEQGTQSESRNSTRGVTAAARPVLRAAAGPPHASRRMSLAPAAAATAAVASGSADPSSTTMTRRPASPFRQRASSAWRSLTGMTTVTPAGEGPPESTGWAIPASSSLRASRRAAGESGTGSPANHLAAARAPAGLSRSTRTGEPPVSTVPSAIRRAPWAGRSRKPAGTGSALLIAATLASRRNVSRSGGRAGHHGEGDYRVQEVPVWHASKAFPRRRRG
jgi:hypothetical protein